MMMKMKKLNSDNYDSNDDNDFIRVWQFNIDVGSYDANMKILILALKRAKDVTFKILKNDS